MAERLSVKNLKKKRIVLLDENFRGKSGDGEELAFTNYYMTRNGAPFFGVSGEFHYSRMAKTRWEEELIKMKLCGINVVSTYVFWNHHEEIEGVFDFSGRRDLRAFVLLCQKHGLYVILRIGPFAHGEVRNGGLPDWLHAKPFEVRTTDPGFLECTRRFYWQIGQEVKGLFFRDKGPIIGVQLDNEYMHSSAPWEMTAGTSDEWVFMGEDGEEYMRRLKELASACGLLPVFYTCTAWGGAAAPEEMLSLWDGYAYRPWIFHSQKGAHPATEEYVYQDFHNNEAVCTNDFRPAYSPEDRPYACCEIGGGMTCTYAYRFQLPAKSVDAMTNIKLGSGCSFLGYYMFHGGSNPRGRYGLFLNEGQTPKISYDYQAVLGEFGQERESYGRLKCIHYFVNCFADRLCPLQTVLPEGASQIRPQDPEPLRYAVRTDGKSGFLFLNNFQDHVQMRDREETVTLELQDEELTWQIGMAAEENAILPFHFDLDGIDLLYASAQPLLRIAPGGEVTYVFLVPDGMRAQFVFEEGTWIDGREQSVYRAEEGMEAVLFTVSKGLSADGSKKNVRLLLLNRRMANQMFLVEHDCLLFTQAALLADSDGLRIETTQAQNEILTYPKGVLRLLGEKMEATCFPAYFDCYRFDRIPRELSVHWHFVGHGRYILRLPERLMEGCKDVLLRICYEGNIGSLFLDGRLIHDHFYNGLPWEVGLGTFADGLEGKELTCCIVPFKEDAGVRIEPPLSAPAESSTAPHTGRPKPGTAELWKAELQPVYEITLMRKDRQARTERI